MHYALVSSSPRVPFASLVLIAAALQDQMTHDLAPAYAKPPWIVGAYKTKADIPNASDGHGVIVYELVPAIEEAPGALAYHTEDEQGRVWGREGVDTILDSGGTLFDGGDSVSSAASHEMCETFEDAAVSTWEMTASQSLMIARELCDPCEGDSYVKKVDKLHPLVVGADLPDPEIGASDTDPPPATQAPDELESKKAPVVAQAVAVSNFVLEAYFDPQDQIGPYDHMRLVKAPGELRPGGYQVQLAPGLDPDTGLPAFVYQNVFGASVSSAKAMRKLASGRRLKERARVAQASGFVPAPTILPTSGV